MVADGRSVWDAPTKGYAPMISALMPNYARADLAFERGEGAWLWTDDGRRFLDFGSGIATTSLGHGHPHLAKTIAEQAAKVMSAHVDTNAVIDDPRKDLTEYLQTKKETPTTILAERQMILEIEHEVAFYKTLKGVPAKQQSNVRNDMYISSEALRLFAKSKKPDFTAIRPASDCVFNGRRS